MRAKKVDSNHGEVRDHLRKVGYVVRSTAMIGDGFPDLIVAHAGGFTALVEVKRGTGAKLRTAQAQFAKTWPGVCIKASSAEDAERQLRLAENLQLLGHMR